MEFKEFIDPLEAYYDINSSLDEEEVKEDINKPVNIYQSQMFEEIFDTIGFLEDGEIEAAGITQEEYMNPTAHTIEMLKIYRDKILAERENNKTK